MADPNPSIPSPEPPPTTSTPALSPRYAAIRCRGVFPGIDLVFRGSEYDFRVAPHADPRAIRISFTGTSRVTLDGGDLLVDSVRHCRLLAYQDARAGRRYIDARFRLDAGEVRFDVGAYDPTLPLIIDPVVVYATYAGGSGNETDINFGNSVPLVMNIGGQASQFNATIAVK